MENKRNIVVRVDNEFHRQLKIHLATKNITLQNYVTDLIRKDLEKEKEKK